MDSYSARANTIFCTFVNVMLVAALTNHATSYLPHLQPNPKVTVNLNQIHDMTINSYLDSDQTTLSFNISHDLETEFHWNTNQLFAYLVAEYNTTSNVKNEVTIWDSIITSKDDAVVNVDKLMVEYPLQDEFRELRGRDVRLRFRYRTMPIVGQMFIKEVGVSEFKTADEYFRDDSKKQKKLER